MKSRKKPIELSEWTLTIDGEVEAPLTIDFETLLRMPKAIAANTLECSGNSRSLLAEKASGNPWTIGGVGNAVWGGVWLKDLLETSRCHCQTLIMLPLKDLISH